MSGYRTMFFRIFILSVLAIFFTISPVSAKETLKLGSSGPTVVELQKSLLEQGLYHGALDGIFGLRTFEAVVLYQASENLDIDGMVGPLTWTSLKNSQNKTLEVARISPISRGETDVSDQDRRIYGELIDWSQVTKLIKHGESFTVIDFETGKNFQAVRNYGTLHMDAEPKTRKDTAILKEIYNGKWSWDRRAVLIQIDDRYLAASINSMPHGTSTIKDNNYNGHFCIHFLNSKTHGSSYTKNKIPVLDPSHQAMVKKAAGKS